MVAQSLGRGRGHYNPVRKDARHPVFGTLHITTRPCSRAAGRVVPRDAQPQVRQSRPGKINPRRGEQAGKESLNSSLPSHEDCPLRLSSMQRRLSTKDKSLADQDVPCPACHESIHIPADAFTPVKPEELSQKGKMNRVVPFITPSLLAAIVVLLTLILRKIPPSPPTVGDMAATRRSGVVARDEVRSRMALVQVDNFDDIDCTISVEGVVQVEGRVDVDNTVEIRAAELESIPVTIINAERPIPVEIEK